MNINYQFKNERLISTALSHSSYANEHKNEDVECNERLEFLGDAILGFVVGEYIYKKFSLWPEGKLTKLRASVVCETMLSKKGRELGINNALKLGKGEEHTGGRERNSIIADAVESVIGAIYLDGGMDEARKFILNLLVDEINEISSTVHILDAKTTLQEIIQRDSQEPIEYVITSESGPVIASPLLLRYVISKGYLVRVLVIVKKRLNKWLLWRLLRLLVVFNK